MSMSRKSMTADNVPIESFHSALKSETFYLDNLRSTTTVIVEKTVKVYSETKQPVTGTIPITGWINAFLTFVSYTGVNLL